MLEDLYRYEHLGSSTYFCELFKLLAEAKRFWSIQNIFDHFYNRVIDGYSVFDGCVPFAICIGAIRVADNGSVFINPSLSLIHADSQKVCDELVSLSFIALRKDDDFIRIFSPEYLTYDTAHRIIQIERSALLPRYANFCQLLINLRFLFKHPDSKIRKYVINNRYRHLFDTELLPVIRKRRMSINILMSQIEQNRKLGREAEDFVLDFERRRLDKHVNAQSIEIISDYDVNAGYDILSFDSIHSIESDRYIEVKSYSGEPNFHWSRNEIDTSRRYKDRYYLYLVDRGRMHVEQFIPLIIRNPFEVIFERADKWNSTPESYIISHI